MRLCLALLLALFAAAWALAVIPEDRGLVKNGLRANGADVDDASGVEEHRKFWPSLQPTRTQPLHRRSGGGGKANEQKQGGGQHSQDKPPAQHTQRSKSQPQQTKNKSQAQHSQSKVKTAPAQNKVAEPAQNKVEAQNLNKKKNQNQQKLEVADTAPASGATNAFDVLSAALSSQRHSGGKATAAPSEKTSTRTPRHSHVAPPPSSRKTPFVGSKGTVPPKSAASSFSKSVWRTLTNNMRTKHGTQRSDGFHGTDTGGSGDGKKSTPTKHTPQTTAQNAHAKQTSKSSSKRHRATPTLYDVPNSRPFYYNTNLNLNKYRPKKTDIHQMDYQGTLGADATSSAYKMGAYVGTSAILHSANQQMRNSAASSRSSAEESAKGTSQPVPGKMAVRLTGNGQESREGMRKARKDRGGSEQEKRRRRRQVDDESEFRPTQTQPVRRSERPRKGHGQARNKAQNKLALNRDAVAPQNNPTNAFEVLSSALSSQRHHTQQHSAPAPKSTPKPKPQPTTKPDAHTGLPLPKSTKSIKFPKTPGYKWPKHSSFVGWGPTTPKTKPNPVAITGPDGKKHPLQFVPKYTSPVGHKGTKPLDSDWAGVTTPASRS